MKRLIIAMLLVLAASAGLINYLETAASQSLRIEQAGGVVGRPINLPNDPRLSDPQAVLAIVRGGAEAAHVNVLRSLLGYTADGRQATTLFVLLTSDTRAFEPFRLQSGRWLTPADADFPSRYLSATPGGGPDQIGVLSVFESSRRSASDRSRRHSTRCRYPARTPSRRRTTRLTGHSWRMCRGRRRR